MNRTGNYTAFYVKEPFYDSSSASDKDFCFYNLMRAWKKEDSSFSFVDSHGKTYSVRDDSSWETLEQRLGERLRASKNIILLLSERTIESKALKFELEYGIGQLKLPVIVVYVDYNYNSSICDVLGIKSDITKLWDRVPTFKKYINSIPSIHIPFSKDLINKSISHNYVNVCNTSLEAKQYHW